MVEHFIENLRQDAGIRAGAMHLRLFALNAYFEMFTQDVHVELRETIWAK